MRILVVSPFWPARNNPITGIFVVQQVLAYLAVGCEVTVLVPESVRSPRRLRPYHQKLGGADVFVPRVIDIPQTISGADKAIAYNSRACSNAIVRTICKYPTPAVFDGVHIHDIRYAGLAYTQWSEQVSGPSVLTLHGVDPFIEGGISQPWLRRSLKELWARVRYVTLVGNPLMPYADTLAVPKNKRVVVHNGSNLPNTWSSHQRSFNEKRVVLSVSNLVRLKGIDLNLKALARIDQDLPAVAWEYQIIGEGPERRVLQKLATELGIGEKVSFLGRLNHSQTLAAIADCDVFSLPSWGENFGIVYLEAMGRGRPVIGCKDSGAAEMVSDGVEGYLVERQNQENLKIILERLLTDPDSCSAMGVAARKRAEAFTWERSARRHLALFDEKT